MFVQYAYWPKMYDDVINFVNQCRVCQENKSPNSLPAGELQPLEILDRCWDEVTCDFVSELPTSGAGFDTVLVIVDKLSKRAIFIPTTKNGTAQDVAQLFQDKLYSTHGVPI